MKIEKLDETDKLLLLFNEYSAIYLKSLVRFWTNKDIAFKSKKPECIKILTEHLKDDQAVMAGIEKLDKDEYLLLYEASLEKQISARELISRCKGAGVHLADSVLKRVVSTGLLIASRSWGNMIELNDIEGDRELELVVIPSIRGQLRAPPPRFETFSEISDKKITQTMKGDPVRIISAIVDLISLLERRKVKLRTDGCVYARQIGRIHKELGFGKTRDFLGGPLVLELALAAKFVGDVDGLLRPLNSEGRKLSSKPLAEGANILLDAILASENWVDDAPVPDPDSLYDEMHNLHYSYHEKPSGQNLREARLLVVSMLKRLGNRGWVDIETFADLLVEVSPEIVYGHKKRSYYSSWGDRRGPSSAWEQAVQREVLRCVVGRTFVTLGLVEVGQMEGAKYSFGRPEDNWEVWDAYRTPSGHRFNDERKPAWKPERCGMAFRLTPLGRKVFHGESDEETSESEPCLLITANFEIAAPLDTTPPEILLKLSTLALPIEGHPDDQMRRFRLEKSSIVKALESGITVDELIRTLSTWSVHPLPENVSRSIADWARTYGSAELYLDRDLLEFDTPSRRDAFVKKHSGAEKVGDNFALLQKQKHSRAHIIDYEKKPTPCLTVHPSGRIDLDRGSSDLVIDKLLSNFAEPLGDPPDTYQITADSLTAYKRSSDYVLSALEGYSSEPLTDGTKVRVRGLCGEISPPGKQEVIVIQVTDIAELRGLVEHESVRKCLAGVLEPNLLVVAKGQVRALKTALSELGITWKEGLTLSKPKKPQRRRPKTDIVIRSQPNRIVRIITKD